MRRILIAVCLILAGGAAAGNDNVLSFGEAVSLALERNPRIMVARNSAEIADNNASIGNAGLLPTLDLTGSAYYQDVDPSAGPSSDMSNTSARMTASYTLFDGFGNIYRYRSLESEGRLGKLEARDLIETTLITVSRSYYGAAEAYENLEIARHLLEISTERLERARQRADFGQGGTVDVLAAKVDFNSDTVTVVQAEYVWEEAKRNLNALLDRDLSTEFMVDREVSFRDPGSLEGMRKTALDNNAAYRASVENLEQAKLGRGIARSSYMPRLSLSASYGYDQVADGTDFSLNDPARSWDMRATLNFNIFDGFQRWTDSKNASIRVRSGELLEKQARLDLERNLANAYESYRNSLTVLDLERKNLEAARVNFRRTRELYGLGRVTSTQFREAQLNLIRAETNVSRATYGAKLNEIELLRITGKLLGETG